MRRLLALALLVSLSLGATALPATGERAPYRWPGGDDLAGASPSSFSYFAEGCTRRGFDEWLCILNPNDEDVYIGVGFIFPSGDPQSRYDTIPAHTRYTLFVNDEVGTGRDVSITIAAGAPILAERAMYFNYKGTWAGNHVVAGAPAPAQDWYFAEGTTRAGFEEWLSVLNPGGAAAQVKLSLSSGGGILTTADLEVPAMSRRTVSVNALAGPDRDVAVRVRSEQKVVVERPMYFSYAKGISGGHVAMGVNAPSATWYFAEGTTRAGFDEYLCLFNPGATASSVTVDFLTSAGRAASRTLELAAGSRTTLLPRAEVGADQDVAMIVTTDPEHPVLAERPMYFTYGSGVGGGSVAPGSPAPGTEWYFAEGCTRAGFEEWLTLLNTSNESADVSVGFVTPSGTVDKQYRIAAASRQTIFVNNEVGVGQDVGMVLHSNRPIVAERPLYLRYAPLSVSPPFTLATADGMPLTSPIRYEELVGTMYHEAEVKDSDGNLARAVAMQPLGACLADDNPDNAAAGLLLFAGGDPFFWIEASRYRGTSSTTAVDVGARAGCSVLAPVTGTVELAAAYSLYGKYPDNRVKIRPDSNPQVVVVLLHMEALSVKAGDRVQAGSTVIGTVNNLAQWFQSDIGYHYTQEDGNHVHMQVNAQ
ncbi:MAG: DUF5719 family protein [Candidatus Geothermincolia bacterium]